MHRTLADPELLGGSSDGGLFLNDVLGQLAGSFLDGFFHWQHSSSWSGKVYAGKRRSMTGRIKMLYFPNETKYNKAGNQSGSIDGRRKYNMFPMDTLKWTREPESYVITEDTIKITTKPHTDLWQRTYYHFRNDNAPALQMRTKEKYFSFVVKTEFDSKHRFDQCGVVMYLDSDNWLKGSIEYENESFQHLGSVVTNHGYSDWATTAIDASIKSMWYRLSRREDDFCIECSEDGIHFSQM
jgi:hypothetical protein